MAQTRSTGNSTLANDARRRLLSALLLLLVLAIALVSVRASPLRDFAEPEVRSSYYELLEVSSTADAGVLKRAYRAAALKWHPDRFVDRAAEQAEANAKFVLIAEAYDVLNDEQKRKEYDLLLEHGHLQYDPRAYAEIMNEKNRQWAGKAGFTFSRRRDANGEDVDDTWMLYVASVATLLMACVPLFQWLQRRSRAAAKKKEGAVAFQRMLAASNQKVAEEEAAREAARVANAARQAAAKQAAAAAAAQARAERDDDDDENEDRSGLTAEQLAEREEHRAAKAAHKRNKVAFRALAKQLLAAIPPDAEAGATSSAANGTGKKQKGKRLPAVPLQADEVDPLLSFLLVPDLATLVDDLTPLLGDTDEEPPSSATISEAGRLLAHPLAELRAHRAAEAQREAERLAKLAQKRAEEAAAAAAAEAPAAEWTAAELSMLAKGTAKYPGGVNNRWEKITELVCSVGSGRTVKEVLVRSRVEESAPLLKRGDAPQAFEAYRDKMKQHKPAPPAAAAAESNGTPASAAAPVTTAKAAAKPAESSSSDVAAAADEWNAEQQAALELALRSVSKTAEDRWDQIAQAVPGKSKKQVLARYKLIKAQIMAAAATAKQ